MEKLNADHNPPLQNQASAAAYAGVPQRLGQDTQSAPSLTGIVPTMLSRPANSAAHTSLFVPNEASTAEQKRGAKHGGPVEEFPHTAFDPESAISTTSGLGTLAAIAQAQAAEAREWRGGAEVVDTKTDQGRTPASKEGEPTGQSRDTKLAETSESQAGGEKAEEKPEPTRRRGRPRGSKDSQPRIRRSQTIMKPRAFKKGQAFLSGYPWMMYGADLPYGYQGYAMDDYVKSWAQWGQMQQGMHQGQQGMHQGQQGMQQGMMQQGMMLPRQIPQPLGDGMDQAGEHLYHGAAFHQGVSDLDEVPPGGNHFPLAYQAPRDATMWPAGQQIPGMMGFNLGAHPGAAGLGTLGGQEPRLSNNTGSRADQGDQQGLMYWATMSAQQQLGMPVSQGPLTQGEPILKQNREKKKKKKQ